MTRTSELRGLERPLTGGRGPTVWQRAMQVSCSEWLRIHRASGWIQRLVGQHPQLRHGRLLGDSLAWMVDREATMSTDVVTGHWSNEIAGSSLAERSARNQNVAKQRAGNQSAANQGAANQGAANQGAANQGAANQRTGNQRTGNVTAWHQNRSSRRHRFALARAACPDKQPLGRSDPNEACRQPSPGAPLRQPRVASRDLLCQLVPADSGPDLYASTTQSHDRKPQRFEQSRQSNRQSRGISSGEYVRSDRTVENWIHEVANRAWRAVLTMGLLQPTQVGGDVHADEGAASSVARQWAWSVLPSALTSHPSDDETAGPDRSASTLLSWHEGLRERGRDAASSPAQQRRRASIGAAPLALAGNGRQTAPKLLTNMMVSWEQLSRWARRTRAPESARSNVGSATTPGTNRRHQAAESGNALMDQSLVGSLPFAESPLTETLAPKTQRAGSAADDPSFSQSLINPDATQTQYGSAPRRIVAGSPMSSLTRRDRWPSEAPKDFQPRDDLGELADKIRLILNEEARRHGIDV